MWLEESAKNISTVVNMIPVSGISEMITCAAGVRVDDVIITSALFDRQHLKKFH